jgi:RNA polymerase sigma factor (sigma-70 family)
MIDPSLEPLNVEPRMAEPEKLELTRYQLNLPHAFARRYCHRSRELYEELVGICSVALMRALRSWRPDGGASLSSWLVGGVRIAARSHTNLQRRSRYAKNRERLVPVKDGFLHAVPDHRPGPAEQADQDDRVRHLLSKLPFRDRVIARLRWLEGWDSKDVAEKLGMNPSTVSYRTQTMAVRIRTGKGTKVVP